MTTTASTQKGGKTMLLIDVQKDFHPGGSLAIESAGADAERIAGIIAKGTMDRLVVTMDSHHKLHIAHPKFWIGGEDGKSHPAPFTIITSDDIKNGVWKPRDNLKIPFGHGRLIDSSMMNTTYDENGNLDLLAYVIEYATALESKGRFKLCIWPEHCLIGSMGHNTVDCIQTVMDQWSESTGGSIEFIPKGENLLTEMYSALKAEVPINAQTDYNQSFLDTLVTCDRLYIVGQAMSHCVNYTTRDIIDKWPKDELHKLCVVTDCMSPVPGFDKEAQEFVDFLKEVGVETCLAANVE